MNLFGDKAMVNVQDDYPERIIPEETVPGIYAMHLKRYDFARERLQNQKLLDIACGVGYGAAHLAEAGNHVIGVDIDAETVSYAQARYGSKTVQFLRGDAHQLPFADHSFDSIVSFETVEHVPYVERYLAEMVRVMKPSGQFFVSTPLSRYTTQTPPNPHHIQEWSPRDFEALLKKYFSKIEIYSQLRRTSRLANWIKRLDVFTLRAYLPDAVRRPVATASGTQLTGTETLNQAMIEQGLKYSATELVVICKR